MTATCKETWHGTTLFLTRYEYANLYHTITDWWNTYFSLPPTLPLIKSSDDPQAHNWSAADGSHGEGTNIPNVNEYRIVFLDGHAHGHLDDTWHVLFGNGTMEPKHAEVKKKKNIYYIKELSSSSDGPICFDHAVLIPPGYSSRLYPRLTEPLHACVDRLMADQFVTHVLQSYHLLDVALIPGRIVIIDRQPYMAHSRSKLTHIQRSISNLHELKDRLLKVSYVRDSRTIPANSTTANYDDEINVTVQVVRLETLPFKEQIRTIREAHILIGNHGAGLTHLMWMHETSHVLELTTDFLRLFQFLSQWRWDISHSLIPLEYEGMSMDDDESGSSSSQMSNGTIDLLTTKVRSILAGKEERLEIESLQQGIDSLAGASQDPFA